MSPTVKAFCTANGAMPFFKSQKEYENFRIRFGESLRPELEKTREARRKSEEAARKRCLV